MNKTPPKAQSNKLSFWLAVLGIAIGSMVVVAIVYNMAAFVMTDDNESVLGELTADCRIAMTHQKVADKGGCLCISQTALLDKKLPPKRIQILKDYFGQLADETSQPASRPPTSMQMSHEIGLVYGHPFLRAYSVCAANGFEVME